MNSSIRVLDLDTGEEELYTLVFPDHQHSKPFWIGGLAGSPKEVLGVSTQLLHDPRIVAVIDFDSMKYKFYRNLRGVSSLNECPSTTSLRKHSTERKLFPGCGRESESGD